MYVTIVKWVTAGQTLSAGGDGGMGWGRGGRTWVVILTGALMSSTHLGRLLIGHSHCSEVVYLLLPVVQPDLSPETGTFSSSFCVPLGVYASFGNA